MLRKIQSVDLSNGAFILLGNVSRTWLFQEIHLWLLLLMSEPPYSKRESGACSFPDVARLQTLLGILGDVVQQPSEGHSFPNPVEPVWCSG